jgi:small subunit ribosomal protein S4
MGDPKKHRKKYSTPGHPWQKARIDEEKQLLQEYGFKNKKEIWKLNSYLRAATAQAKKLVTLSGPQADKERELLLSRLKRYGLLSPEAGLDAILSISLRDVLERRLQTIVYKQNLANSAKQARQFITHNHVCINNRVVTSPSYLVPLSEEGQITFRPSSGLTDPEHPERLATVRAQEKASKEGIVVAEEKEGKEEKPRKKKSDSKPKPKKPAKKKESGSKPKESKDDK